MPLTRRKRVSRRRLLLKSLSNKTPPKRYAVATWNLTGIGRDGWGKTSWLKFQMVIKKAISRGWRAILITDCSGTEPGTFKLRGLGGHWLLIFGLRSGVLLDPGLARCWERGGSCRFDPLGGRSCGVLVPCAGRGVRGKILALFSFYALVSDAAFDDERRSALNELSILGSCHGAYSPDGY